LTCVRVTCFTCHMTTRPKVRDGDILTRSDALKVLGISSTLLDRMVKAGELPFIRTPSGYRLYWAADVKAVAVKRARKGLKVARP